MNDKPIANITILDPNAIAEAEMELVMTAFSMGLLFIERKTIPQDNKMLFYLKFQMGCIKFTVLKATIPITMLAAGTSVEGPQDSC